MMFKKDILGENFKLYTQETTLWKFRQEGATFVKKLSDIFAAQLAERAENPKLVELATMTLKYGTLDQESIELYQMGGLGQKSIEILVKRGITTKEKFFSTPLTRLKVFGIRMSKERFNDLRKKAMGESTTQTTLGEW